MIWYLLILTKTVSKVFLSEGKGKGQPITGDEGPEGEKRYSSTLSLTSAVDGVGGQRHSPAALPPRKDPVPILQEAG